MDSNSNMPFAEQPLDVWLTARNGMLAELQQFVNHGVDVNAEKRGKITPLHEASEAGHLLVVEWLLGKGADLNARTMANPGERGSYSPLHLAVESGHYDVAKRLLTSGSRVNAKMSDGATALLVATEYERRDLVDLLMENGADVTLCDQMGARPLSVALFGNDFDLTTTFLSRGGDINQRMEPFEATMLMLSASAKALPAVQFLLSNGASVTAQDERGQTVLHHSVFGAGVRVTKSEWNGKVREVVEDKPEHVVPIVQLLLRAGADPEIKDDEGMTPQAWAKKLRLGALGELLESRGPW